MDQIITGDCLQVASTLEGGIAALIVTSPPYPGQKGDKRTVDEWLQWFDPVMGQMVRVLSPVGILALNVMFKRTEDGWFDGRLLTEIPALIARHGLNMIDVYPFVKPNPAPNGALTYCDFPAWEPVFVATKAQLVLDYHFEPIRRPYKPKSLASNGTVYSTRNDNIAPHPDGARQSNVLVMSSSGDQNRPKAKGQSFPLALPERFVLQNTRPGELVVDFFAGVGTTCRAAQIHGRSYLGIELNPQEAEKARRWLKRPFQQTFHDLGFGL